MRRVNLRLTWSRLVPFHNYVVRRQTRTAFSRACEFVGAMLRMSSVAKPPRLGTNCRWISSQQFVHDFFKSSSVFRASPPPFSDTENHQTDDLPTVQEEVTFSHIIIRSSDFVLCKFFVSANLSFWAKCNIWSNSPHFNTAFMERFLDLHPLG